MSYLDHAYERLQRYFAEGAWDLYDGVAVVPNSDLTVCDIILSVALNSQLDTRNKIWHVWQQKRAIEEALTRIPSTLSLSAEQVPWEDLFYLFEAFCSAKYAKEAVATKVLHKKRPALIPIYDRVVGEYFRPHIDARVWQRGGAAFLIQYMQLFRQELLTHEHEIDRLCALAAEQGWLITPVRMLEVLIWIEYDPLASYR